MSLYGSCLDFPIRTDARGAFVTTGDPATIVAQAIRDIVETLRGEHMMKPNYGLSRWIFEVMNPTFVARISHEVETQVKWYVPNIAKLVLKGATDNEGRAVLKCDFWLMTEIDSPKNLVFPIWQYRSDA